MIHNPHLDKQEIMFILLEKFGLYLALEAIFEKLGDKDNCIIEKGESLR